MEMVVEAVNKTNFMGIKVADGWKNADKRSGIDFKELHPGDVIEATLNPSGFITAYKVVGSKPVAKKSWSGGGSAMTPERQAQMSRGAAVKAVLGMAEAERMFDEKSDEEALAWVFNLSDKIARYIEKGA